METLTITKDTLRGKIETLKSTGYRFVTITCVEIDDANLELIYHFDKDLELTHFRMAVAKNESIPSISPVFFAAFLVENEVIDLFGVTFEDLALDFGGTLYLDDDDEVTATPFCKFGVKQAAGPDRSMKNER